MQVAKKKSDLTFLKRCRDASLVPVFARISHPLNNSKNRHIFFNLVWLWLDLRLVN